MDPYESFAERYDLSFGIFGMHDPQVVEFFRQLFSQNDAHRVLDCACGTGRHLPLFHSLGCEVCGSDVSASMLAQARINLAENGLHIPLYQADFRDLPSHFRQPFDAVVCLAAIGFMTEETELWGAELRVFLRDDQERVLKAAGFRAVDFYGSFDFSPFDKETSNSLITVAHK